MEFMLLPLIQAGIKIIPVCDGGHFVKVPADDFKKAIPHPGPLHIGTEQNSHILVIAGAPVGFQQFHGTLVSAGGDQCTNGKMLTVHFCHDIGPIRRNPALFLLVAEPLLSVLQNLNVFIFQGKSLLSENKRSYLMRIFRNQKTEGVYSVI